MNNYDKRLEAVSALEAHSFFFFLVNFKRFIRFVSTRDLSLICSSIELTTSPASTIVQVTRSNVCFPKVPTY